MHNTLFVSQNFWTKRVFEKKIYRPPWTGYRNFIQVFICSLETLYTYFFASISFLLLQYSFRFSISRSAQHLMSGDIYEKKRYFHLYISIIHWLHYFYCAFMTDTSMMDGCYEAILCLSSVWAMCNWHMRVMYKQKLCQGCES